MSTRLPGRAPGLHGDAWDAFRNKAIGGVLAALAQGLVNLSEAREAIDLIERCRKIMGPPLPAAGQNIEVRFVTGRGGAPPRAVGGLA